MAHRLLVRGRAFHCDGCGSEPTINPPAIARYRTEDDDVFYRLPLDETLQRIQLVELANSLFAS